MKTLYICGRDSCLWFGVPLRAAFLVACHFGFFVDGAVQAAPLTLSFEAEIASVTGFGGGIPSPTNAQSGETFGVQFTYDPDNSGGPVAQFYPLKISFDDLILSVNDYFLQVANEIPSWVPLTGSIADPLSVPIDDRGPGGVSDSQFVFCGSSDFTTSCDAVPNSPTLNWIANLAFYDENTTLNSSDFPVDDSAWNSYSFREMSVNFVDMQTGAGLRIGAYIGEVRQVPEPSMAILSIIMAALIALFARRTG